MRLIKTTEEIKSEVLNRRSQGADIGLVPTMGALHRGHLELVKRAINENKTVVVSIFVNPTQFNDKADLDKYPRTIDKDLELLKQLSDDIVVFMPDVDEMYEEGLISGTYDFGGLESSMEGSFREGHFEGVATVVEKLLRKVTPDRAYFGEKDYQQLQIIKRLVTQKGLEVEIIACAIVREESGLALSSRNTRLSKRLRNEASFIYNTLKTAKNRFGTESAKSIADWVIQQFAENPDFELEYFVIADDENLIPVNKKEKGKKYRAFIAVYAEGVRLIDNIGLN